MNGTAVTNRLQNSIVLNMHEILAVKQQTIYKLIEADFLVLQVLQVPLLLMVSPKVSGFFFIWE
jgi:hypothetical protein